MILITSLVQCKCKTENVCVCEQLSSVLFLDSARESSAGSRWPSSMRRAVSCTGRMCESWWLVSKCFCILLSKEEKPLLVISLCIRFCHFYEHCLSEEDFEKDLEEKFKFCNFHLQLLVNHVVWNGIWENNFLLCCSLNFNWFLLLLPFSGRIRNKAEVDEAAVDAILSLNIISAKYLKSSHSSNR